MLRACSPPRSSAALLTDVRDLESVDAATSVDATSDSPSESGGQTYAMTVLSDQPLAYWRLGDAVPPSAKDSSGNGHDGTYLGSIVLGAPGAIAGDSDTAAVFNGGDALMQALLPSAFDFSGTTPFSVEAWIKPTSDPTGMAVLGKNVFGDAGYVGYFLAYNVDGALEFYRVPMVTADQTPPAAQAFFHFVATFDGFTLISYVNGTVVASDAQTAPLGATGTRFEVGAADTWGRFTGVVDEVAIYGEALPAARVVAHYNKGVGK